MLSLTFLNKKARSFLKKEKYIFFFFLCNYLSFFISKQTFEREGYFPHPSPVCYSTSPISWIILLITTKRDVKNDIHLLWEGEVYLKIISFKHHTLPRAHTHTLGCLCSCPQKLGSMCFTHTPSLPRA